MIFVALATAFGRLFGLESGLWLVLSASSRTSSSSAWHGPHDVPVQDRGEPGDVTASLSLGSASTT